ncbi:putative E3 ubiquitin-protein ligase mug30 [Erysiphe neolycopersici]|uniref:HECT-type E3 ubiquitin transferase n=1 Tax=Erysiphe neolycopersici TaxID=212602 RepID=A0A420HYV1_9PEZI|nr:putative E3 ubiquitin-protein ligase mug30 [Erysiphe neolycopersici]
MPQWSSRLLSPSSRNKSGGSGKDDRSSSPPMRLRPKVSEPELLENASEIESQPQDKTSSSKNTKASKKTSHNRSVSNPFPSIFSSKKKPQGKINPPHPVINFTNDNSVSGLARESANYKALKQRYPDENLMKGKCITCDSLVRWPKELYVFRCTVCLTINDLKPIILETRREDGYRIPIMSRFGVPTESPSTHQIPLLSLEKINSIVDNCVTAYLLDRLKHSNEYMLSPLLQSESPQNGTDIDEELPEKLCLTKSNVAPLSVPHLAHVPSQYEPHLKYESPQKYSSQNSQNPTSHQFSSSTPGNFFSRHKSRKEKDISLGSIKSSPTSLCEPSEKDAEIEQRIAHNAKKIFKPLEDHIVSAFGSFECVNSSFCTARPNVVPRTMSEGQKCDSHTYQPSERKSVAETQISEMDAKTLLLGDFAENGSWWTGSRTDVKNVERLPTRRSRGTSDYQESNCLVTLKSPRINWAEVNEWYHSVLHVGKLWRRSLEFLKKTEKSETKIRDFSDNELNQIENDLLEARIHVQRTLLKATETLLKRPSRPLSDPSDLRFLLIFLANPLLYTVSSNSRGKQRRRSKSNLPCSQITPVNQNSETRLLSQESSSLAKGNSAKHSGIIKRILGLLSNVSNECHHHLVSWFTRYPENQFRRTTELIGSFVTYRLLRQNGKKREIDQDPTAGLIPKMPGSGRNSSAALHAALGVAGQSSKKHDGKPRLVVYSDDWQIRAAARVMSLLFSANSGSSSRRVEGQISKESRSEHITSLGAREKAFGHGQIIATTDFYNTLLDCSDLIADFEAWETRRSKFSFCQYPFFLSIWAKIQIMEYDARRQMEVKAREAFFDSIMTRKTIKQYLELTIRRDCLVEDSLKAVSEIVGSSGEEIKKGLRIKFKGEEGIDAGGLRKEWFLLLVRDVFNPEHGMFTYDEDSRYCYFNPNSFETTDQFFLVGVVLGLAIHNSTILDVALPPFAFRKLLAAAPPPSPGGTSHAKPIMTYSLADLAQYRPALANGLRQLLEYEGDVESTFCRDFLADVDRYGQITQVPLCPNGEKRTVTNANRREFVDLYVRYLLDTAVSRQFEPFKRGFFTVCGGNALSLFRPEEIELLIRGSDENLDIASLRAVCIYDNWSHDNADEDEPVVQWFWETFQAAKSVDQRKLLSFITGSDRIPAMGATNLVIKLSCLGGDGMRFPVARTCFNQLSLWQYSTKEKLERMLWRAVYESEGFGLK